MNIGTNVQDIGVGMSGWSCTIVQTLRVTAASSSIAVFGDLNVFGTPRGSIGNGFASPLTAAETNIQQASRIPFRFFSAKYIGFQVRPVSYLEVTGGANDDAANITVTEAIRSCERLTRYVTASLQINSTVKRDLGPIYLLPAGVGLAVSGFGSAIPGASAPTTQGQTAGVAIPTNGFPAASARVPLATPLLLRQEDSVQMLISLNAAVATAGTSDVFEIITLMEGLAYDAITAN